MLGREGGNVYFKTGRCDEYDVCCTAAMVLFLRKAVSPKLMHPAVPSAVLRTGIMHDKLRWAVISCTTS
jgi:hypothetical protein